MILTLKELADYLRVNERTILRMLKTGQIKGAKIGGQWRFNGSQIDGLFFPGGPVTSEDIPLADFTRSHLGIPVSRVMHEQRMIMDLKSEDAEQLIKELASPALFNTLLLDIQDLQSRLFAREKLLSTGVGNGIAIPHPRDPIPTLRQPAVIVLGRSKKGIDFNAADGKPVHLFFLLCCQNMEIHLHVLGCLAQLLRNEQFIASCKTCDSATEVLKLVMELEREHFLDA